MLAKILKMTAGKIRRFFKKPRQGADLPPEDAGSGPLARLRGAQPRTAQEARRARRRAWRAKIRRLRRQGVMGANGLVFAQRVAIINLPAGRYGYREVWPWGPKHKTGLRWPWGPRGLRLGLDYLEG